jgi:hypothetical protein
MVANNVNPVPTDYTLYGMSYNSANRFSSSCQIVMGLSIIAGLFGLPLGVAPGLTLEGLAFGFGLEAGCFEALAWAIRTYGQPVYS